MRDLSDANANGQQSEVLLGSSNTFILAFEDDGLISLGPFARTIRNPSADGTVLPPAGNGFSGKRGTEVV